MPGVWLASDAEIARASRDQSGAFRRLDGHFKVSAIGFDEAHTEALIWVDLYCGSLCGSGTIVFLVREQGTWKVAKADRYYIS